MQFEQTQLENGLTVLAEVNPAAQSTACGFFVRTGSRDETPEVAGVSHFLEHMMFKGTDRRSPFDINREFDEMGAVYNAFTSEENTVYFAAVLPEFQERSVDQLGDMLRPALREEDFDTEKNVILEEIALYEDRPQFKLYEKLMARHFAGHPLGNSILGTPDSIRGLKRDDMQAYFDRRYSPSNVTLVGVGRIDWDAFVAKAEAVCGHWQRHDAGRERPRRQGEPSADSVVDAKLLRQNIALMSPAPSGQDERRYAAHLLAQVVGDVTGSRLYYALVEPGIAEEASCSYDELDGEGGFITLIAADPDQADRAVQIAREELAKVVETGPTEAELRAAKNKTASAATLKGELPMGRLIGVGFDWVYRGAYVPLEQHIERIFEVTCRQVADLAREYDLTATTTLSLGPRRMGQG
jgi:predicted Zn-dependent peptidase